MLLLLDENMDVDLELLLPPQGMTALHIQSLRLKSAPDPLIFRYALANGYDALVTKDAFGGETRAPSYRAMRDGLRIFRIRITPKDGSDETGEAVADLLFNHAAQLEAALSPDSPIRHVMLNMRQNQITKTTSLAEIEAELERLSPEP